jgi:competence protein ComEC
LDVGHGLAAVLHLPNGNTLLYDAGLLGNPRYGGQIVSEYLWSRGVRRIDALVLSHADVDHYNVVPFLHERFAIRMVFLAPSFLDFRQRSVQALMEALDRRDVPIRFCWREDRLKGGGVDLRVLHPPAQSAAGSDNAASLVLLVSYGEGRLLLTGDLEGSGVAELLAMPAPRVDVLLLPHHGSPAANPPELFAWADPRIVVVSQRRSQVRSLELAAQRRQGIEALSTAEGGAIAVTLERDAAGARYVTADRE